MLLSGDNRQLPTFHYGFGNTRYTEADASTWEGETDALACDLRSMRMQSRMRCLGTSAGVASILSVVATQTDDDGRNAI